MSLRSFKSANFAQYARSFSKSEKNLEKCETMKKTKKEECKIEKTTTVCPPPYGGRPDKKGSTMVYNALSFLLTIPLLIGATYVLAFKEAETHRPDFVPYEYLRRRTKKFPWGDGNKSLFHNPKTNALPDGYETELDEK